jgi:hypothetical protein
MIGDTSREDYDCMPQELITALRLKPMAIKLATVEQIVPYPAHQPQHKFSFVLVVRENIFPIEQAIGSFNLFLWRMLDVVLNGYFEFSRTRRFKHGAHFGSEGTPISCWVTPIWFAKADNLQAVLAPREFTEELES